MKKILIATDFSPAARNAVLYGIQLAKATKAEVVLFSVYSVGPSIAAAKGPATCLALLEETKKKLIAESDSLVAIHDGPLQIIWEEGIAHQAILSIAKEEDVDLIIAGITGKYLKPLFGSTVTALLKSLTKPLILVPEDVKFTNPKNILYASDVFLDTSITAIDQVKWLTECFRSKLFVLRVVKDDYEEVLEKVNTPQILRKELKALQASFSFPVNKNTADGLNEFISEQPVDLMVMMPRKHEWIERLFVKSETKDMLFHFHSHIPILKLPDTAIDVAKGGVLQTIEKYSFNS